LRFGAGLLEAVAVFLALRQGPEFAGEAR